MKREDLLEVLRGRISDRVIDAMISVPREIFVPEDQKERACLDTPLPIGRGQTISAPHMVAIMTELLDVREGMSVLDVGGGSGYHAAILARLVGAHGCIYSIERIPELAATARRNLERAGVRNVVLVEGDGSLGLPEHAPYDRINVAASAPEVPEPLKEQLKVGGRMAVPVGSDYQELIIVTRTEDGFAEERMMGVAFVPLIGEWGFRDRQSGE